jgi:hypothetical protein
MNCMPRLCWLLLLFVTWFVAPQASAQQQDRAKLVREDLAAFDQDAYWIYNDLESGIAKAKETGRPLLVVFR